MCIAGSRCCEGQERERVRGMDTKYIHSFIQLAEQMERGQKNIRYLDTTQKECIAALETEFGGCLLDAAREGYRLTETGYAVLEAMKEIRKKMAQTRQMVRACQGEEKDILIEVNITPAVFMQVKSAFQKVCPDIRMTMSDGRIFDHDQPLFRIISSPCLPEEQNYELLFQEDIGIEVYENHPLAKRKSVTLEELAGETFSILSQGSSMRKTLDWLCRKYRFIPRIMIETDSDLVCWQYMKKEGVVAFVPVLCEELYKPEEMKIIRIDQKDFCRYVLLVWEDRSLTPQEDKVRAFMVDYFQNITANSFRNSGRKQGRKRVFAQTFGYFDLYVDGSPVYFPSRKAKELLAFLINRRGGMVSMESAIDALWPEEPYDERVKRRYRNVIIALREVLHKYELEELVIFQRASTCLNRDMLDCDLYGLLKGEPEYQETFQGEYMNQYSWAEPDLAALVQWCGK